MRISDWRSDVCSSDLGRDQEREEERRGLGYLNASDLRPQAAAQVWQNLMGEIGASTTARGIRKPDFKAIAFTASHPPQGERAEYLAELAYPSAQDRDAGFDRFRAALATISYEHTSSLLS